MTTVLALVRHWINVESLLGREHQVDAAVTMTPAGDYIDVAVDGHPEVSGDAIDAARRWDEFVTLRTQLEQSVEAHEGLRPANENVSANGGIGR